MTEPQRQTLVNNYYMLKGLYERFGSDIDWINIKRNQNSVADQIVNWGTKTGDFNKGYFSFNALKNVYKAKKFSGVGNEKDHTVKTKTLAFMVWENMAEFNDEDDYIQFMLDNVHILSMTRKENKNGETKSVENPIDRYKTLGINFIYKSKSRIRWNKISSFKEFLSYFDKIPLEEWLL